MIRLLLLMLLPFGIIGQNAMIEDHIELQFKKTEKVSSINLAPSNISSGKNTIQIFLKVAVKQMKRKDSIDSNAFSLVDHRNKRRYRLSSIAMRNVLGGHFPVSPITKRKIKGNYYRPEIKDTFLDYSTDGYTDIDPLVRFNKLGSFKYAEVANYYFFYIKKCGGIKLFFNIPELDPQDYDVFYGNEKLFTFKI